MLSGARTTSASIPRSRIDERTRSSLASSRGQLTGAPGVRVASRQARPRSGALTPWPHPGQRRRAVTLVPGDDRVPQHADVLDLRLDDVARPEVEQGSLLRRLESGHTGHRPGREDVAGRVAE